MSASADDRVHRLEEQVLFLQHDLAKMDDSVREARDDVDRLARRMQELERRLDEAADSVDDDDEDEEGA